MKTYIDQSWDFKNSNTKIYTHCMHNYPAMMIPQIANRLIEQYGNKSKLLFDPYCGTGTSLVEANLHGINAIGTDLNPLARLISKVKTQRINIKSLKSYIENFNNFSFKIKFKKIDNEQLTIPKFKNIHFWFKENVIYELAEIKQFIEKIEDKDIADFFKVAFSETVRESSFTRNSEFKLYRMPEKQRETFNPNVFDMMILKLMRNLNGYSEFYNNLKDNIQTEIYSFNTCNNDFKKIMKGRIIDLIVTSPPYGDSRTTVAYGQFSRLSNQWLDIDEASQIDKKLMGGEKIKDYLSFNIKILDDTIKKIYDIDKKRGLEVISFYIDLQNSINNVSSILKKNSYACYVVGNRKVKGNVLPTDNAIASMFEKNNFKHIETIIRNIPSKKMPKKNSPTNEIGIIEPTMNQEYIVIMQKK